MEDKIVRVRIWVVLVLLLAGLVVWIPEIGKANFRNPQANLEVHFFDVGQGDAIFIKTPDGIQVLIDGGPDSSVLRELGSQMKVFDRNIDLVIATHSDKDHIGGLIDVLNRYDVKNILLTENKNATEASDIFSKNTKAENASIILARRGQVFQLGASTTLEILSPAGPTDGWESNNASIIVQLRYGDIEFMLTGDAPYEIEDYLVSIYGDQLESEVLKLGHHGSKTSTSETFLEVVDPEYAVVSSGKDNRYGHPNKDVIGRTIISGAKIYSTIEAGTISFVSDGREVWLK